MIKKLICKILGHCIVEECYAKRYGTKRYQIVRTIKCMRCGKIIKTTKTEPKSRAILLQEGWFIVDK